MRNHSRVATAFFLIAATGLLSACTVEIANRTPTNFPWTQAEVPPRSGLFYPESTSEQLGEMVLNPMHRFALEVKPKNVSNISAFITVNGTEYPMTQYRGTSGKGLWVFQSPNECQASYRYYYRVRYKAGSSGWKSETLGSQSEPLTATVVGSGSLIWWIVGVAPPLGNGTVRIGESESRPLHFQNLANGRLRIDSLGFDAQDPDVEDFELVGRPTTPFAMTCGQGMKFDVKYGGPGTSGDSRVLLVIPKSYELGPGNWRDAPPPIILTLEGRPTPP